MSSLRCISSSQQSPQLTHRQVFPPTVSEDVEDLFQQMELEDNAFEATEQRMASSGWSTETELGELRAKRQAVRREWEERIENARMKKRRGSDSGHSTHGSLLYGTMTSDSLRRRLLRYKRRRTFRPRHFLRLLATVISKTGICIYLFHSCSIFCEYIQIGIRNPSPSIDVDVYSYNTLISPRYLIHLYKSCIAARLSFLLYQ